MSETWKEKRKLLLSLGTHKYEKPTRLPPYSVCKAVLDTAENRLLKADNDVGPIEPFIYVYSDQLLYVNGLPAAKERFYR